ncbi:legumin J-like isoform X3 [Pteropus medius]|uniref:legumin J-like isoform X3 n=1 Tax=Pteropus vampyrus TaxID=132908 RepID=UPI00196B7F6D|nr:legumin J-like isoform X3 [Pteropus giganteus]
MDNLAFEMHEGATQHVSFVGKMNSISRMEEKRQWSLLSVFLACLLACTVTTAVGVLILSLVYINNTQLHSEPELRATTIAILQKAVDPKFQFLNHLPKSKGTAWIGVVDDGHVVTTYNVTAGQVIFFPKNTLHWIKNVGNEDCFFLLFFSTHDELQTLDVDDAFFSTPEDIASRSLKPEGGINFIRTFHKQKEDQGVNLPHNLAELVTNASYTQSPDNLVWRYFYDLKGSKEYRFPGGIIQLAQYWKNGSELSKNEKIFSTFLNQHQNTLALSTLKIYNNGLRQPHFHFNANEMGYVISGCAKVGIINTQGTTEFDIHIGDVIFFPIGTQHYIKSACDEDLLFILAFSTGDQLQTLDMDDYLQATADHILAQLFFKKQSEFKKIPKFKEDQAINLP